jgi:hypothetical protein
VVRSGNEPQPPLNFEFHGWEDDVEDVVFVEMILLCESVDPRDRLAEGRRNLAFSELGSVGQPLRPSVCRDRRIASAPVLARERRREYGGRDRGERTPGLSRQVGVVGYTGAL